MAELLEHIDSPEDLKKLPVRQLNALADEIRQFILSSVAQTGGHLASNLGVVELTLALHYVFDFKTDKLLWDVGHQCYTHKIITGRKDKFKLLRKAEGISSPGNGKKVPGMNVGGNRRSGNAVPGQRSPADKVILHTRVRSPYPCPYGHQHDRGEVGHDDKKIDTHAILGAKILTTLRYATGFLEHVGDTRQSHQNDPTGALAEPEHLRDPPQPEAVKEVVDQARSV